ncbi:hypothetical protein INT48_006818, partial [Thamnidium elegans]
QVFDFEHLRLDLNYNGKQMFTNMVRTNYYGIDFILAGPERQSDKLPNLDLNDFTPEEINEHFHLWGIDPGQVNIFTASDGYDTDPHQLRKYSIAEYYTRAESKKKKPTYSKLQKRGSPISRSRTMNYSS